MKVCKNLVRLLDLTTEEQQLFSNKSLITAADLANLDQDDVVEIFPGRDQKATIKEIRLIVQYVLRGGSIDDDTDMAKVKELLQPQDARSNLGNSNVPHSTAAADTATAATASTSTDTTTNTDDATDVEHEENRILEISPTGAKSSPSAHLASSTSSSSSASSNSSSSEEESLEDFEESLAEMNAIAVVVKKKRCIEEAWWEFDFLSSKRQRCECEWDLSNLQPSQKDSSPYTRACEEDLVPQVLHHVMTTRPSLQQLYIEGDDYDTPLTPSDQQTVASAFRSNSTLQEIHLDVEVAEHFTATILNSLHESRALKELRLRWSAADVVCFIALSTYLGGATCTLDRLEIHNLSMLNSHMEKVMLRLQHSGGTLGVPTTLICALSLIDCDMHEGACEHLFHFLQTPTTDHDGKEIYKSCLSELSVRLQDEWMSPALSARLASSLLMGTDAQDQHAAESKRRQAPVRTIGSQIKTLYIGWFDESFLDQLRDNANRVRLHALELEGLCENVGIAFYNCIPKLDSLRKLKLIPRESASGLWFPHLGTDWFGCGLQANGSVLEVACGGHTLFTFSANQQRMYDVYCQRNRLLGPTIASQLRVDNADDSDHNDGTATAKVSVNPDLLLRPSLLRCAKQIPRTHTGMVIGGLLALGQNMGH